MTEANRTTDRQLSTPGPWRPSPHSSIVGTAVVANRGIVVASVLGDRDTAVANARLIAAAPDLLASLKEMGDWIAAGLQASDEAWPDARCLKHTEEIAARARAAVDKAEGRA